MSLIARWKLNSLSDDIDNRPLTNYGATVSGGIYDNCYVFDGTTNRLTTDQFDDIKDVFSFSLWINVNTYKNYGIILIQGTGGQPAVHTFSLWSYASGNFYGFCGDGTNYDLLGINPNIINTGEWAHITYVLSKTTFTVYLNGEYLNSIPRTVGNLYDSTIPFSIGADSNGVNGFNGNIQDVQIYDHVLTPKEVKQIYLTPQVHLDFNNDVIDKIIDKSGWDYHSTIDSKSPIWTSNSKIGSGSYNFNVGTLSTMQIAIDDLSTYEIPQHFSNSFWVYIKGSPTTHNMFWGSSSPNYMSLSVANRWYMSLNIGGVQRGLYGIVPYNLNEWIHVTYVYDGTTKFGYLYHNGELVYTYNFSIYAGEIVSYPAKFTFGNWNNGLGTYTLTDGDMNDIRWYPFSLTSEEVKSIYKTRTSIDKNSNISIQGEIKSLEYQALEDGFTIDPDSGRINLLKNGSFTGNVTDEVPISGNLIYEPTSGATELGCLYVPVKQAIYFTKMIQINPTDTYKIEATAMSKGVSGDSLTYIGCRCVDYKGRVISSLSTSHYQATETTLAQDFNTGDTVMYLTNIDPSWYNNTQQYAKGVQMWYEDESLNEYPVWTRSLIMKYDYSGTTVIDFENNTITFPTAWTQASMPAGSYVANLLTNPGSFNYLTLSNQNIPSGVWTKYTGYTDGIQTDCTANTGTYNKLYYGTTQINFLILANYQSTGSGYETLFDDCKIVNMTSKQTIDVYKSGIDSSGNCTWEIDEVGTTDGLVGYWPLNGELIDISGNKNNLTSLGTDLADIQSDLKGLKSYHFESSNNDGDYLTHIGNGSLDITGQEITLSAWVRYDGIHSSDRACIMIRNYYLTLIHNNGNPKISVYCYGKTPAGYHNSIGTINPSGWSHIAAVWTTTHVNFYINGVYDSQIATTGNALASSTVFSIGREGNPLWGRRMTGNIQECRIYDRALTPKEISILYSLHNPNSAMKINKYGSINALTFNEGI